MEIAAVREATVEAQLITARKDGTSFPHTYRAISSNIFIAKSRFRAHASRPISPASTVRVALRRGLPVLEDRSTDSAARAVVSVVLPTVIVRLGGMCH